MKKALLFSLMAVMVFGFATFLVAGGDLAKDPKGDVIDLAKDPKGDEVRVAYNPVGDKDPRGDNA